MSEMEKKILENSAKIIATMDGIAKAQYLAYGEGMLAAMELQGTKDKE